MTRPGAGQQEYSEEPWRRFQVNSAFRLLPSLPFDHCIILSVSCGLFGIYL